MLKEIKNIVSDIVDAVRLLPVHGIAQHAGTTTYDVTLDMPVTLYIGAPLVVTADGTTINGEVTVIVSPKSYTIELETTFKVFTKLEYDVQYIHGHLIDITETLQLWSEKPSKKDRMYPLIILPQDINEPIDNGQSKTKITLFICTDTMPNFSAAKRYEETFEPILYPLYSRLISKIEESFDVYAMGAAHSKIDRLYWGREGISGNIANTLNDFIDAIEVKDFEINILTTC